MGKTFDLKVLSNCQERVQLILGKTDLSIVHKAEDIFQILTLNPSEIKNMTGTSSRSRFSPEQMFEDRATGRQDQFVGRQLHLSIVTG